VKALLHASIIMVAIAPSSNRDILYRDYTIEC